MLKYSQVEIWSSPAASVFVAYASLTPWSYPQCSPPHKSGYFEVLLLEGNLKDYFLTFKKLIQGHPGVRFTALVHEL